MPAASLDYYSLLGIARSVSEDDVKRAFRKLALKWHPDRAADKAEAESMFPLVCEAYDVLSHPARRSIFDQYGEFGLKNGIPDGMGGFSGGRYAFAKKPEDVFTAFFGTASPFADLLGPIGGAAPDFYGELTGMTAFKPPVKGAPLVIQMLVTLGEIYTGATKKLTFTRRVLLKDKTTEEKAETIHLRVAPGWEDGTVATYPAAGDEDVSCETADVQVQAAPARPHRERPAPADMIRLPARAGRWQRRREPPLWPARVVRSTAAAAEQSRGAQIPPARPAIQTPARPP